MRRRIARDPDRLRAEARHTGGSRGGDPDWSAIYGLLASSFGWTDPDIDETTLPALEERYFPYLTDHPPVHLLVAAYLGVKPTRAAGRPHNPAPPSDVAELLQHGFAAKQDVHEGFGSAAILDFAELKRAHANR